MMITWTLTKKMHGMLAGITVTDTLTADASQPPPFQAQMGQRVAGIGCDYTVVSVERA